MEGGLKATLSTAGPVTEDVHVVEGVELFQNHKSQDCVRSNTEEVGCEALPKRHHAFRLHRATQNILETTHIQLHPQSEPLTKMPEYSGRPLMVRMFWMRVLAMSTGREAMVVMRAEHILAVRWTPKPSCINSATKKGQQWRNSKLAEVREKASAPTVFKNDLFKLRVGDQLRDINYGCTAHCRYGTLKIRNFQIDPLKTWTWFRPFLKKFP